MLVKTNPNQLTFVDGRFYTDEDGQHYPSATTILEAYPKPYQLMQWMKDVGSKADEIRDAAGRRGSNVHQLTEDYDNGLQCNLLDDNGKPRYSLEEWNMFERYVDFSKMYKPEHLLIEQTFVNGSLGFAGTLDRICTIDGKSYVLDIKTSNGIYNSYWLQLAAYEMLYMNAFTSLDVAQKLNLPATIDGVAILWLNAKTRTYGKNGAIQGPGWQMVAREDRSKDWDLFQSVQKLWLAEHEDDKPREFSYQLSHKK
jgi:hypothetical protein